MKKVRIIAFFDGSNVTFQERLNQALENLKDFEGLNVVYTSGYAAIEYNLTSD